ncbi:RagB/SusD family nutrient uptake outer membrane protein [Niabella sp. W65]|nr:RagB/SusD family nutrient uptake outer membrane protein [Niabella sp. W65]MCH7362616.1 RagB/SusD family nutrient uptake outer membrane protein [Niabella sp. W65]
MQELWRQSYNAINAANVAIDKIAAMDAGRINEPVRQRLINEAKFLRALHYFNLVRWFGGVPIVIKETPSLSEDALYVAKATEDEVYNQIMEDLKSAEQLPKSYGAADIGRATSGAAKSLLAKVYLTKRLG